MDRDIALQLSSKLNDIKTSLTTIATNTTPTASTRGVIETRSNEETEFVEPEPVEPETRNKK